MTKGRFTTGKMVRLAVLAAIMIVLEVTGIGLIKTMGLELTILHVPVIIGAILMGPGSGMALGFVFGMLSFIQCLTGKSPFGAMLLSINPIFTFIVCVPTRMLMGWLCGRIFKALHVAGSKFEIVSFGVAGLSGALLNTVFFMGALILLFGRTDYIMGFRGDMALFPFLAAFIGVQGLIEAGVCFITGTVISRILYKTVNKMA